jgi:hypothetical protein
VILSGAFLAEAAATVDNKLNVQGGVLSRFALGPDRFVRFLLVVLTAADTENSDRKVQVEFNAPELDEPIRREFEVPAVSIGEFPGFAFFPIDLVLPVDGRWVAEVSAGGSTISLPIEVSTWKQPALGI